MIYPKAVFFGSIGTLAETSELQRQAFNRAFAVHGLDWVWDQSVYRSLLQTPGGIHRIEAFARSQNAPVNAAELHVTKTEIYQELLAGNVIVPRDGVMSTLSWARLMGIRTGLVSTTSRSNIERLLNALSPMIDEDDFDIICDASCVEAGKPAPDVYEFALKQFGLSSFDAVAIEDTEASLRAAHMACIPTIAFPGENAVADDFRHAAVITKQITPEIVRQASSPQPANAVA